MPQPKTFESQLVISAKDKTEAAFDEIGRRFDRLAMAGKRVNSVGRDFLNVASAVDRAGNKLETFERRMGRIETLSRRIGKAVGPLTNAGEAYAAWHTTRALGERAAKAATEGQHERVRMETAGMSAGEIAAAEGAAAKLSAEFKPLSQTTILHALRNARAIVGSYEEAAKVIEPMMRLRVIAQGAHPERSEELEGDFDQLIKGMEIKGVTQDLPKFTHYIDNMAKALNVFGDTLRPTDYYEMFKYGRAATQALSDKFMLMTAPTFAQEMGGSSAGKAFSTFYSNIVGGRMRLQSVNELMRFGLIDKNKVEFTRAGLAKRVSPGAVIGSNIAAADPYRWVNEVFLPALAKKGVIDKDKIQTEIAAVFRDQTAAQLVSILATQQSRVEKDWRMIEHAHGLDAADTFMNKDVAMGVHGVTEQLTNLLQVAGSPLVAPATAGLKAMADALTYATEKARQHPIAASGTLLATVGGGALAAYEAAIAGAAKIGLLGEGWASSLMRAPLQMFSIPAMVGYGGAYLSKSANDAVWANPKQFGGISDNLILGALAPDFAFGAAVAGQAKPELTGNAQLNVHVTVAADGRTHVEGDLPFNDIPGVKIGTTGSVGKSWDDVVPGL